MVSFYPEKNESRADPQINKYVKKDITNIMPAKSKDLIPEKRILKIIMLVRGPKVNSKT